MHWKASMDEGSGESADAKVVQESKSDSSRVDVAHREWDFVGWATEDFVSLQTAYDV